MSDPPAATPVPPRGERFSRPQRWLLAMMVVLGLAALAMRGRLQAAWWSHQFVRAATDPHRRACALRLAALRGAAAGPIDKLLQHPEQALRLELVRALSHLPDERWVGVLDRASRDIHPAVRHAAIDGLGHQPPAHAIAPLTRSLNEMDEGSAMHAASALAATGSDAAWDVLLAALPAHPLPGVRTQIIEEISEDRRTAALPNLVEALADTAVYEGLTLTQQRQREAFPMLAPRIGAELGGDAPWTLELPQRHVIGEEAAAALRTLTGIEFGYDAEDPASVRAAVDFWKRQPLAPHEAP